MRKLILAAAVVLVGCSGASDPMNRGSIPAAQGDYPLGPYGYTKGSIIANLQFSLKVDPDGASGTAAYSSLTPNPVSFLNYYDDPNVGWLVLTGAAGWCGPCNEEAQTVPADSKKWEPKGVRFVTVLIQGYDEADQTPSTMADVDRWQAKTNEHIALGTDPKDNLHDFASEIASFPLNMLIRTADMSIQYTALGIDSNDPSFDPILTTYVH